MHAMGHDYTNTLVRLLSTAVLTKVSQHAEPPPCITIESNCLAYCKAHSCCLSACTLMLLHLLGVVMSHKSYGCIAYHADNGLCQMLNAWTPVLHCMALPTLCLCKQHDVPT